MQVQISNDYVLCFARLQRTTVFYYKIDYFIELSSGYINQDAYFTASISLLQNSDLTLPICEVSFLLRKKDT